MNRSPFLLGVLVVAAVAFVSGCITVPESPLKTVGEALRPPGSPDPSEGSTPGTIGPDSMGTAKPAAFSPTLAGAKEALAAARKVYTDAQAALGRLRADMDAKAKAVKEAERQAVADRIVRDGWWVFAAGMIGSIVGVVCVAKNYGMGGWWVLLGGGGVAVLGLGMVWLGPHWLGITRGAAVVFGLAMIVGAMYAWRYRKKLKAMAAKV